MSRVFRDPATASFPLAEYVMAVRLCEGEVSHRQTKGSGIWRKILFWILIHNLI